MYPKDFSLTHLSNVPVACAINKTNTHEHAMVAGQAGLAQHLITHCHSFIVALILVELAGLGVEEGVSIEGVRRLVRHCGLTSGAERRLVLDHALQSEVGEQLKEAQKLPRLFETEHTRSA